MARQSKNEIFDQTSFLYGANAIYIEQLYVRYLRDPASVSPEWREFFDALAEEHGADFLDKVLAAREAMQVDVPEYSEGLGALDHAHDLNGTNGTNGAAPAQIASSGAAAASAEDAARDSLSALMMARAYRIRGHLAATLDPLEQEEPQPRPELRPETYGFSEADLDRPIYLNKVLGLEYATARQMVDILQQTYCGKIGYEFMHISNKEQRDWLLYRIEGPGKGIYYSPDAKRSILSKMIEADGFEKFLHRKYQTTKRFGIDGGETLIPAMEQVIQVASSMGVEQIVLGMPHRGRLNVLANVMGKSYRAIFHEFEGNADPEDVSGSGDVKYHLGASSDREFEGRTVHLSLTANPSHLEAVNPVVLGKVRAKQAQINDSERAKVLPLLLHGDAAFAGQGVVAECFGLSGLRGHRTGGTVHIVVNNQIGFTTAPLHSRSSPYPSDVALMVQAPILHVNGDDPEAVVHAARIATEFRQTFSHDVVIDLFCYRRFGHNEGDEPSFTQPRMYEKINKHPRTLDIYIDALVKEGVVTKEQADEQRKAFDDKLEQDFQASANYRRTKSDWLDGSWRGLGIPEGDDRRGTTAVDLDTLRDVGLRLTQVPEGFNLHKTLRRILDRKKQMIETGRDIDWATAESLAFGSLLIEGYPVRLSGQDSMRGTFSQRHSGLIDQKTEERYLPLNTLQDDQAQFEVIDSMLSENAVLGFEYGYSLAEPNALVLWEAQFGDFVNGAQVVIDQFISSGERKWLRMSGLVMLLPHGYEGQGPEHSSARMERFLQMCAEDNMQIANCTTPASYFHILRRQIHRNFRKPLILMTPKSLLRHKRAVSLLEEMGPGTSFHRVLLDDAEERPGYSVKLKPDDQIRRVVVCSGKVYYDLFDEREKRGLDDIQILRLEQLYPFPNKSLLNEMKRFPNADVIWCQEEPGNMGAWTFVQPYLEWVLEKAEMKVARARYAGRKPSAATATGFMSKHREELESLLNEALTIE